LERADSVRSLSLKKPFLQDANATNPSQLEPTFTDANDDEVNEINRGKEYKFISTSNSKPGLLPDAQTTAFNKKLNLGLPEKGTFSDPHDGQDKSSSNDQIPSISTQQDLPTADVFHESLSGANIASFDPISANGAQYSSAFVDQQAAKSIGKEKI
jgi:hypothetical protein